MRHSLWVEGSQTGLVQTHREVWAAWDFKGTVPGKVKSKPHLRTNVETDSSEPVVGSTLYHVVSFSGTKNSEAQAQWHT